MTKYVCLPEQLKRQCVVTGRFGAQHVQLLLHDLVGHLLLTLLQLLVHFFTVDLEKKNEEFFDIYDAQADLDTGLAWYYGHKGT